MSTRAKEKFVGVDVAPSGNAGSLRHDSTGTTRDASRVDRTPGFPFDSCGCVRVLLKNVSVCRRSAFGAS